MKGEKYVIINSKKFFTEIIKTPVYPYNDNFKVEKKLVIKDDGLRSIEEIERLDRLTDLYTRYMNFDALTHNEKLIKS